MDVAAASAGASGLLVHEQGVPAAAAACVLAALRFLLPVQLPIRQTSMHQVCRVVSSTAQACQQ